MSPFHDNQLTVAEHSAYDLRSVITHLDGLTIARTTKLTTGSKDHAEDELIEAPTNTPVAVETQFHGGENVDHVEPEDELIGAAEMSAPLFGALNVQQWTALLSRCIQLEGAQRPGRKSQEVKQMKAFDELFHTVLHSLPPNDDALLQEVQTSYSSFPTVLTTALDMHDGIMKRMKRIDWLFF